MSRRKTPAKKTPALTVPVERLVLRLFVWNGFCPGYTDGLAFAVAETVEQAKALVIEAHDYDPDDWGTLKEFDLGSPVAFAVAGGG